MATISSTHTSRTESSRPVEVNQIEKDLVAVKQKPSDTGAKDALQKDVNSYIQSHGGAPLGAQGLLQALQSDNAASGAFRGTLDDKQTNQALADAVASATESTVASLQQQFSDVFFQA